MADLKAPMLRPLSPHIQIYRWPITMLMSILHRITGAALHVGTLLLAAWLIAAAMGPSEFAWLYHHILITPLGLLVLVGYTWALMHHMLGGIRHLIWDLGYGMERKARVGLSYATVIGSVVLTGLIWMAGWQMTASWGFWK